jgi:hypothetical protein
MTARHPGRPPHSCVAREGQRRWLGEALATPGFQPLLCGRPDGCDAGQAAAVRGRYREAWPSTT